MVLKNLLSESENPFLNFISNNSSSPSLKEKTLQNATIFGFAKLAEYKDHQSGMHIERIQSYVKVLTYELYKNAIFKNYKTEKNYLTKNYIEEISLSSILHDIGKLGIPEEILLKPERLTKDEYKHMQLHTNIGGDTIKWLDEMVGSTSFLKLAKEVAYFHHEKWNGNGYPIGLSHEQIPLSARITAVCDVYDALRTIRPYKNSYSHEKACEIIYDSSGSHFDPIIISIFSTVEKEFRHVSNKYSD